MAHKVVVPSMGTPSIKPALQLHESDTRLFDLIAEEVVHGDRDLFDSLSPYEREQVLDWMSDALVDGVADNAIHDLLWEIDFIRKPVSIETFLEDDRYFGKNCAELHDNWKRDLCAVFGAGSQIQEWICTGAIGVGKTTAACAGLGYKAYFLNCLKDPARYYGLLAGSEMYVGIYSITKRQVNDAGFAKLKGWVESSMFFREEAPHDKQITTRIAFTQTPLEVVTGSTEIHTLGTDLFSFMMDEANFMHAKTAEDGETMIGQAYKIYNSTIARLTSRFIRPGGTLPGIAILLSSRNSETDFLEERIKKVKDSPRAYISDYKLWEVKDKSDYATIWDMPAPEGTKPKFRVMVGDRVSRSRILKPEEEPRDNAKVLWIPGEVRQRFEEDIDQALRDIAGVATFNLSPLVSDRSSIFESVRTNLVHPFREHIITLGTEDDTYLEGSFNVGQVCKVVDSKYVPRLNAGCPRFIHGDLALSGDAIGLAMCHMSGFKRVEKTLPDGTIAMVENPFILMDFMLRICAPPGQQMDYSKIRGFIIFLRKFYNIEAVSFDSFQSADMIQILHKQGMTALKLSMDTSEDPYLALRNAHYERRIAMYEYSPYVDEMLDLQRNTKKRKVDHPAKSSRGTKGSKDVADAVAGCTFTCISSDVAIKSAPAVGNEDEILSKRILDPRNKGELPLGQRGEETAKPIPADAPQNQHRINGVPVSWDKLRSNVRR